MAEETLATLADSAPAAETQDATATSAETPEASAQEAPTPTPQHDPPSGVQKRIDKLTRQFREQERENERLRAQVETMMRMREGGQQSTPQPAPDNQKPRQEDYDSHDAYVEALADWKVEQRLQDERKRTRDEQLQRQKADEDARWNAQLETARRKYQDWDEVLEDVDIPVSPALIETLRTSDVGADLTYYLATHPDDLRRISALTPLAMARELGKIETRLGAPPVRTASQKPAPPAPLSSVTSQEPATSPGRMSYQEYEAWYEKTHRNKG